ncbi:MAG TPA: MFS transporter [Candidatus Acidoferrum sp.]|nr:MFS transporter [Candidatus Acidoferrum sp.]
MSAPQSLEPNKLRRLVFATSAGTIFKSYDFILFGSVAPLISAQFFAGINETAAFIIALLTFAAGYLVRPLGALYFGSLGDRKGRKQAFLITITLMGLATFGIGLLPTYAAIGVWAPVLLVALRLIQGLAMGGEYGAAIVYTAEHAPPGQRGLYVGWIQGAAGFAVFLSFFIVYLTRTALGEDNFARFGWRIPFLISIVLLAISLQMRSTLEESPLFQRLVAEGKAAKRPLQEAFGEWSNLKLVILSLLGLLMLQGVVFYTVHFYSQFFIMRVLKLPPQTMSFIMMCVTLCSVPLYVLFAWLSDRWGRKPLALTGAVLTLLLLLPIFHGFTAVVNPALSRAQTVAPVVVTADPVECSLQFDPVGQTRFVSSCDIAKSTLAALGIGYRNAVGSPNTHAVVTVGDKSIAGIDGTGLSGLELAKARAVFKQSLLSLLKQSGYESGIDTAAVNLPLLGGLMLLLVVLSTLVYTLTPIMALELFPTQIRYSALSLPYQIGAGWFGGFMPAIAFAMVAANGDIYYGLWYPLVIIAISVVVLALWLPETRHREL